MEARSNIVKNLSIVGVTALFFSGWAVVYADRTTLYPLLPVIGDQLKLSNTQLGLLASAYFIPYVAMQIPAGYLGDRFGHKRILSGFYGLSGFAMLALGLVVTNFRSLLLLIGLVGLGAGAFFSTAYGYSMGEAPPERRGLIAAIINSGMGLGLAIGLIIAGPVYQVFGSWKIAFLILAIPTLALAFLFAVRLEERRTSPQRKSDEKNGSFDKGLLPLYLAFFCSIYAFWVVVTWGPSFLYRELGFSIGLAGSFIAVVAIVAIPSSIGGGRISDRVGRKRISLIILPLAALSVIIIASANRIGFLLAGLILYGMTGKLTWDPIATAWVGDRVSRSSPQKIGASMGKLNFAGMLSAIVAPVVTGWITDYTGSFRAAFYLSAGFLILGTLLVVLVKDSDLTNITEESEVVISNSGAGQLDALDPVKD